MYYEEKLINDVLCSRCTPNANWEPLSAAKLSARCIALRKQLDDIRGADSYSTINSLHEDDKRIAYCGC